jgi:uncharacterized delta-60 repeat protein
MRDITLEQINGSGARSHRGVGLIGVLVLVFLLVVPAAAQAASGELDTSFGTNGIVSGSTGKLFDTAVQTDGKIIVVGTTTETCAEPSGEFSCHSELLIRRYNPDGTLDNTFGGGDGTVTTDLGSQAAARASSVVIGTSGEILVGGTVTEYASNQQHQRFLVARYQTNGGSDTSFGAGTGIVTAAVPGASGVHSEPGSLVLQSDGKVVIGGYAYTGADPSYGWQMALARFTSSGTLDNSYGSGGIALGPSGAIYSLAIDSSDRVVAVGWTNFEYTVARFTSTGTLDTSFAGSGTVHLNLNATGSKAGSVLITPDGKILAGGYGFGMFLIRLNEDGSFDTSFGDGDGIATPTFGEPGSVSSSAIDLALQPDGRILIGGQWEPIEFKSEWAVARLYYNGMPDTTFGSHGLTSEAFEGGGYEDYATGVALQPDGNIVLVGNSGSAKYPSESFGIMSFLGGGNDPEPAEKRLSIQNPDADKGRVSAQDLDCGFNCKAGYEPGETIGIRASGEYVQNGSEWVQEPFAGWTTISGDPGTCVGTTNPCQITMNDNTELKAEFGSGTGGGGEPGGGQPGGGEPGGGEPAGGSTGTAHPGSSDGGSVTGAPVTSTPAPSTHTPAQAVAVCVSKAKSVFKRKVKVAKHNHGKAKMKAIKAAVKQKSKRVAACRR